MTLIIFIIILGVLVLVHELGHFLAAKKAGVRVDEFGFGYPPRALVLGEKWGTKFSLNWIPFGGFVKIFGENYDEPRKPLENSFGFRFTEVSKKWQAVILAGGVTFNILFAWVLFSIGLVVGLPTSVDNNFGGEVKNPALTIIDIRPDSPAENAGLKAGDKIKNVSDVNGQKIENSTPESVSDFVDKSSDRISLEVERGDKILNFEIVPQSGLVEGKKIIGINMDMVGTLSLPIHKAFIEGGKVTWNILDMTVFGIFNLIKDALKGEGDLSSITGPVGIVGLVGDASRLGFTYLLTFTALISINLAVVNLIPIPALDGGRLLFVAIESITRRPINPKFAQTTNTIGFALLITLMLIVTYRDILKLF